MTKTIFRTKIHLLLAIFSLFYTTSEVVAKSSDSEEFVVTDLIGHHIGDAHSFHIIGHTELPLPVILYSNEGGFDLFLSSAFHHNDDGTELVKGKYLKYHEKIYLANEAGQLEFDAEKHPVNAKPLDFSITKNVFSMLVVVALMLWMFISVAGAYRKRKGQAPKGMQSFMEPIITFIRDDVAKESLGEANYRRFTPYLLTLFFFIWFNNLMGLVPIFPGSTNVSGNIAFTLTLAALSLLLINFNGSKDYWGHILWPPGMPIPIKLILIPIELVGILAKPFALMIRLFANITGGHIVMLSIVSLIFILGPDAGTIGAGGISIGVVGFTVFMYMIKLFVAALQAFIFTLLTAIFLGQAMETHAHGHEGDEIHV